MSTEKKISKKTEVAASAEEIIDVEQYCKEGKPVPPGCRYRISVDKEKYVVESPALTGCEILETAGKNPPEQFILTQKLKGGKRVRIGLGDVVDLTQPGIERFDTMAVDPTEG